LSRAEIILDRFSIDGGRLLPMHRDGVTLFFGDASKAAQEILWTQNL
jgi:hypothetical protein